MAGVAEITQEMVDQNVRKLGDFDAAMARANLVLLQTLKAKDVTASIMPLSPEEKWNKSATDYVAV